eukprot:4381189-Prymnesium_polylepis.1
MLLSLRRVPCTLNSSVAHLECASFAPEASAQPPPALQSNAALAAPSALHAQHERASPQVHQPHTRSQRPGALSAAAQCCCRRAECDAHST